MPVTIPLLNRSVVKNKDLDTIVKDHLRAIDACLLRSTSKWGTNTIKYVISNAFNFQGLERVEAEKIIYSKIIRELEKKQFKVKILTGHKMCTLYISWETGIDQVNMEELDRYLAKHMIKSEDELKKMKISEM